MRESGHDGAGKWWVMLTIALGAVATILPSGSFIVAVPALMRDFGLDQGSVQLVVTVFMVSNTVTMLAAPWLIQRFGVRRCFSSAMAVLIVTSVMSSLSLGFGALLVARLLQGTTAAILTPMGSVVVMRLFPPQRQGRAFGLLALSITLALAIAPGIGGVLVDRWSWRAVCLLPVPMALAAWIAALRLVPREAPGNPGRFDRIGMALLAMLTLAWLAGLSRPAALPPGFAKWWLPICMTLILVAAVLFGGHLRRAAAPLVAGDLLRRPVLMVAGLVNFLLGFGMYGAVYLLPVFLQEVLGMSASLAGAAQLPGALALSLAFPLAGVLTDRFDPRHLVGGGLTVFAASFVLLWYVGGAITYLGFIGITAVGRIGQSFALTPVLKTGLAGLSGSALNQAAMILNYLSLLGGVLGVAGVAGFVSWRGHLLGGEGNAATQAFTEGYLVVALSLALAIAASLHMKAVRAR